LHLKVAGQDFHNHLRQVHLRPGILVLLLRELFSRKHEAFLKSSAAQNMNMDENSKDLEEAVFKVYPETESDIPLEQQLGIIPSGIREEIESAQEEAEESSRKKQKVLHSTKNATPGDAAGSIETCLDDIRPKAFTLDSKPTDCTEPEAMKRGALQRYGELHIHTGNDLVSQWESKYFSMIMPFVFPRMCSGPDFTPDKKWRRGVDSPAVTPMEFNRAMARRLSGSFLRKKHTQSSYCYV
jgi:hypothetical protein